MPSSSQAQTSSLVEISDDFGLYLSSNDELPPTLCPDLVPAGWELFMNEKGEHEVLDFNIGDEYVEAYVLQRAGAT